MGIWKKVEKFKPVLKPTNRDILVVSRGENEKYFYVLVNHDNIKNDIMARIYQTQNEWYIWYEHAHCRMQVKSFTEAVKLMESEIMRCVA